MNLIIGLLILICLVGSEMTDIVAAENVWARLFAVALTAMCVPSLAFFQTAMLLRRMKSKDISSDTKRTMFRWMTASHAAVWLSASLAIVWALRWQDVVRGNWNLDQWPIVDEFMILAPIVLSMVASWAIFFELQVSQSAKNSDFDIDGKRQHQIDAKNRFAYFNRITAQVWPRIEFVAIRFRLYFLMILAPIGVFVLARDLSIYVSALPYSVAIGIYAVGALGLLLVFPLMISVIWRTSRIEDDDLHHDLLEICERNNLQVLCIRQWKTGNQIVNAVVAGMVPRFRMILLSDGLLNRFDPSEIAAVVRHEAGHIRLWHLPTRLFFLLLPLAALAVGDWQTNVSIDSSMFAAGNAFTFGAGAFLIIYNVIVIRWLSHQMEFEADMFAIQSDQQAYISSPSKPAICKRRAEDMCDALLRLAAFSPNDFDRNSFFHPSLNRRIRFIQRVVEMDYVGLAFTNSFARRRRLVGGIVLISSVLFTLLMLI